MPRANYRWPSSKGSRTFWPVDCLTNAVTFLFAAVIKASPTNGRELTKRAETVNNKKNNDFIEASLQSSSTSSVNFKHKKKYDSLIIDRYMNAHLNLLEYPGGDFCDSG